MDVRRDYAFFEGVGGEGVKTVNNSQLKFDKNDLAELENNTKQKLILVENTYKGSLFKADIKNKTINKSRLRIVKANN